MSIAGVIDEGIGPGATIPLVILDGLSTAPTAANTTSVVCGSTSWIGYSLQEGQSPAVAVGDTFVVDNTTLPGGYAVTTRTDGTVVITDNGDTTRQTFKANIYDSDLSAYYGTAFTVYVNNHPPIVAKQPPNISVFINNPIPTLDFTGGLTPYVTDQEKDTLTSTASALPTGVTLANNVLSGTPTAAFNQTVTFTFTDPAGGTVSLNLGFVVDAGVIVPNVVGDTETAALASLNALGLGTITFTSFSATVPLGDIIAQTPAPGQNVFSGSLVTLVMSLGPQGGVTNTVGGIISGVGPNIALGGRYITGN